MILIGSVSLLFTFALCAGFSVYLWPYRRSPLHRILLLTQACYALWALWVILIFMTDDFETRMLLTRLRQVTNPLLAPTWIVMSLMVFHRALWERIKKWALALYIIPGLAMAVTVASILKVPWSDTLAFHDFKELPQGHGLLSYKVGPILAVNFAYAQICILVLYGTYLYNFIMARGLRRHYALWFALAGILHIGMDFAGKIFLKDPVITQTSILAIWPVALVLYFAVTRLEFLDIKSLAQQRVFESLPSPVITMTPHQELWDVNQAAQKLFALNSSHIGKPLRDLTSLAPALKAEDNVTIDDRVYQVFHHEIEIKGGEEKAGVCMLTDVSEITALNEELNESNQILKTLNNEILRMTDFNRKVQSVLSHDLTGSLSGVNNLLIGTKKIIEMNQTEDLKKHLDQMIQASSSSLALLGDVLAWSAEEDLSSSQDLQLCLQSALSQLSVQILNKEIQLRQNLNASPLPVRGPRHMIESILRNVLSNAIKFSHHGGIVAITISSDEQGCLIEVKDHGVGMTSETRSHVLAGTSQKRDLNHGYGVGMRFTLEFIEKLQGKIRISSEPGLGTEVQVRLPCLTVLDPV